MNVPERLAALNAHRDGPERQTAIIAAMQDSAIPVRDAAIRLAARYIEPHVLGTFVADDVNAVLRNAAIAALERQGPYAVPYLEQMLGSDNHEVVMFVLQVLARSGSARSAPAILPLLRHPDANVAQSAIEALGRLRAAEAVPALLGMLGQNLWLQLAAIAALGEIGAAEAVGPLLALVPDTLVADPAVHALQKIAAPEALVPLLERLQDDRERGLRDSILEAIGVVIDLHPDARAAAAAFGQACLAPDAPGNVLGYLAGILGASEETAGLPAEPGDEPERGGGSLLRAAAGVVVVAQLRPLYPSLLVYAGHPESGNWVEALWRRHGNLSSEELLDLVGHAEPTIRRGALLVGSYDPEDLPIIMGRVFDESATVRAAACRALGGLEDPQVVPTLIDRLRHGEPIERAAAADALGRMPAESLDVLLPMATPTAPVDTLLLVLSVFERCGSSRFEAAALDLCRHRVAPVRRAACRVLSRLPGPKAELALLRALGDKDEAIQVAALDLLVRRGGQQSVTTLVGLLSASDSLRYHVIRALGRLKASAAVPKLSALYDSCALHERLEIVAALIAIAPSGLVPFLVARLAASEPEEIRQIAAHGVAALAEPQDVGILLLMAGDADWTVRNEAAAGLGRLGLPAGQATLLTLVRDIEAVVAQTARTALEQLGGGALRAIA
ncbi:MAG TPA: HEAT repeat domain-containing protein [Gemmatimonadales bacterium]|nr:HEAT repeat domain-containing protein [Gemmatimonadales bacterium]